MNQTDLLFEVTENVEFFRDINDKEIYYAEFENDEGKREFALLDSESFKSFLHVKSCELTDGEKTLEPDKTVKRIRYFLNYHKNYSNVNVYVRTSGNLTEGIEYDLQNDSQETVKVTTRGWHISSKKRRFVIPKVALPQVTPIETDKSPFELLKPFVNVKGDTYILLIVWLIQSFSLGTHYAPWISASKGCGKTTLCRMIKRLVDPCNFDVIPIPDKKDDLYVLLYNSFFCCFDNLSSGSISNDISDSFCGAITGTAITKRSLYTDLDLKTATLHNTIAFNGIDISVSRDDLAERLLLIKLNKITPKERRTDTNIWDDFNKALPEILGSIFNTLSLAMNEIKDIKAGDISRIGDAFVEMIAIAKALGITEEKFRQIFADNVQALKQARSTSPLVESIKEFMTNYQGRKFQGKADKVLTKIRDNFSGDKVLLPQTASHFTRQLEREHENLVKNGYRINIDDTGVNGTDVSIIKKKK